MGSASAEPTIVYSIVSSNSISNSSTFVPRLITHDPFQIVRYDVTHHSDEIRADFDALEEKDVAIAGRLMSKRIMGKASFCLWNLPHRR